uniref:WD_REPEATS_REGION domain-containing protein n=1 Tax=Wuchereria bancrofti TaxID=6293 RepID=A0A1I8ES35_WUCBA
MTEEASLKYGINLPTRSIVSLPAGERTLFLVGTQSLKQDNQIYMLEVDDDWLDISTRSFDHPSGEIWSMSSSFVDSNIFATCYVALNDTIRSGVGLWKMNDDESNLVELAQAEFHPSGNKLAIVVDNSVLLADVVNSLKIESSTSIDGKTPISASVWNFYSNGSILAVAYDTLVEGIDVRTMQKTFSIKNVNSPRVRNLDFNPNVEHIVATCGDDFRVTLWDIRKVDMPLKVLQDHRHWVWCVKFNPFHDQLLLSAGSDARLFLNSVESLSSESNHALALDDSCSIPEKHLGYRYIFGPTEILSNIYITYI